jgi:GNAT superfamily N-acetyltransferase
MSDLVVYRVTTAEQKKQFLQFPWTLYRNDPYWIPPLRDDQKALVGYKPHPFYERNSVQTFIACRGDEVVGRIAAILNEGHILRYNERIGFFGFFDCRDDQEAANGLFDAARYWFAEQGIFTLRGPTNPSLNYELGLLIQGFDSTPTFMMTYNPPYYERLVENYGFRKSQDLYAFWGHIDMLPQIAVKLKPIVEQIIERYNVKTRPLDKKHFKEDVELFLSIYNRSLGNTWGFVPMSPGEIKVLAGGLQHIIVPEMAVAVEVDGKVVGAAFGLPDYNPRIKEIDGRLFPFGFIHLLKSPKDIKRIRLISTNVLPEYQRMGFGLVLMHGLVPKALEWGLQEGEFSWVLESNKLSYGALKKGGAKITKTYRIYDFNATTAPTEISEPGRSLALPPKKPWVSLGTPDLSKVSGDLEVHEVLSSGDINQFVDLPWEIYAEDPHWAPPLKGEVKDFINRKKHPFYKHGEATQFLATRGGKTVGRILVSDDPNYNKQHSSNTGCFGMFESVNNQDVANALLNKAAEWLRGRGRTSMIGPIDYSTNYPCGLLIDGFDMPPRVMMNHQPRYYQPLLESWGLGKAKDLCAWWFVDPHDLVAKWKDRLDRLAKRCNVTIRSFNENDFDAEVDRCQEVYNSAMTDLWGFVKLTDAEFKYFASQLRRLAIAEQVLLAEVDGKIVGISVTLPDMNEIIRPLNGRLTKFGLPFGLLRLLYRKRRVKTARMLILDVVKEYRRRGIAEMLISRTLDYGKNVLGYTGAELGWTLEDNSAVTATVDSVGAQRYKTYRIYTKDIG